MIPTPLTKELLESRAYGYHVRSAVEGLRDSLKGDKNSLSRDWCEAIDEFETLLDYWFPVFALETSDSAVKSVEQLSEGTSPSPNISHSQPSEQTVAKVTVQHSVNTGELSDVQRLKDRPIGVSDVKHATRNGKWQANAGLCKHGGFCKECGSLSQSVDSSSVNNIPANKGYNGSAATLNKDVTGAATAFGGTSVPPTHERKTLVESVAKCSSVYEDNDMIVNCELSNGHTGEHRINGELGFHWKTDLEETAPKTKEGCLKLIQEKGGVRNALLSLGEFKQETAETPVGCTYCHPYGKLCSTFCDCKCHKEVRE